MTQTSVTDRAVEAVEALWHDIDDCRRASAADRLARYRAYPLDALAGLRGASPFERVECRGGPRREHVSALRALAAERHAYLIRDVAPERFQCAAEYAYVHTFLRRQQPRTPTAVMRSIDAVARWLRPSVTTRAVALPCILWADPEPADVTWGPVRFLRTARFLTEFPTDATAVAEHDWPHDVREIAERAGWVAVVRVQSADSPTATHRAELAVDRTLALLQACLGPSRARVLCRAATQTVTRTGYWELDAAGARRPTLTVSWPGMGMGHPDWVQRVRSHYGAALVAAESFLSATVDPAAATMHGQRYLDALAWFGDGVADGNLAARLVKQVIAWERLASVTGAPRRGVSQRVCRTLAEWLAPDSAERRLIEGELRGLYAWRSRLVHGDHGGAGDQRLAQAVHRCEVITANALLAAAPVYAATEVGGATAR